MRRRIARLWVYTRYADCPEDKDTRAVFGDCVSIYAYL